VFMVYVLACVLLLVNLSKLSPGLTGIAGVSPANVECHSSYLFISTLRE